MKDRSQQPPPPGSGFTRTPNQPGLPTGAAPASPTVSPAAPTGTATGGPDTIPQQPTGSGNPMLDAYARSGNDPNGRVGSSTGAPSPGFGPLPPSQAVGAGTPTAQPGNPLTPTSNGFGDVRTSIDTSNVPGLPGGDALGTAMRTAQDAAYKNASGYLDPQWGADQKAMETKLINQGVQQNSEAWNKAMDDFGRQKEFAYSQARSGAVQQGNAAQNQLFTQGLAANQNQFGQNSAQAQFYNQAQQQLAQQGLSQQQITNSLRTTLAQQGLTQQQIDNLEQQNRFNNSMTMRNQDINELLLRQNNPLNMLNSLNSGQQVQQPQFTNTPGSQMSPADIMTAFQNQYGGQLNGYNAQTGAANSNNSAIASIIAAYLCDRRLKKNIRMIGMHVVGVPLYEFDYVWGEHAIGVMADELEAIMPEAILTLPNGYKAVRYEMLQ